MHAAESQNCIGHELTNQSALCMPKHFICVEPKRLISQELEVACAQNIKHATDRVANAEGIAEIPARERASVVVVVVLVIVAGAIVSCCYHCLDSNNDDHDHGDHDCIAVVVLRMMIMTPRHPPPR